MKKLYTLLFTVSIITSLSAQTQIPNGDFETWEGSGSSTEPQFFNSNKTGTGYAPSGPQTCFKETSNPHSGTSCVRMETLTFIIAVVNGSLTSGIVNAPSTDKSQGYIGTIQNTNTGDIRRIAFTGRADSLVGYYKYTQSTSTSGTGGANERGKIRAILHKGHYYDPETPVSNNHPDSSANKVADALFLTPQSNVTTWTRFAVPFNYVSTDNPQYILINCTPSNNQMTTVAGSKLWLDDLQVVYVPATSVDNKPNINNINVYTADSKLFIDFKNQKQHVVASIFDITGKIIYTEKITNPAINTIDISSFSQGLYLYQLNGEGVQKTGKFLVK
jgi:Putative carbohydrate metabolism domain/Secretion system C-terminal sorting domain